MNIKEIKSKINTIKKIKEEIDNLDPKVLIGKKVRISKEYANWLKLNQDILLGGPPTNGEVDTSENCYYLFLYEKRPKSKIIDAFHDKDGGFITVELEFEFSGHKFQEKCSIKDLDT